MPKTTCHSSKSVKNWSWIHIRIRISPETRSIWSLALVLDLLFYQILFIGSNPSITFWDSLVTNKYTQTVKPHLYQATYCPGNMLLDAGNMLPVSRQHVSLCIPVTDGQQTDNNFAGACCRQQATCWRQHFAGQHVVWCKRGLTLPPSLT